MMDLVYSLERFYHLLRIHINEVLMFVDKAMGEVNFCLKLSIEESVEQ